MGALTDNALDEDSAARAIERHRISRELHCSTSQLLVALQLQLRQLKHCSAACSGSLLDEIDELVREICESIKAIGLPRANEDDDFARPSTDIAKVFYFLGTHLPKP